MAASNARGYPAARGRPPVAPQSTEERLGAARAGEHYSGAGSQAAVAAEFGRVQLWNPDDSGVDVFIAETHFGTGLTGGHSLFVTAARFATRVDAWRGDSGGDVPGHGEIRRETGAVALATRLRGFERVASGEHSRRREVAVWLKPGQGLAWESGTVNTAASAAFAGREQPRLVF